MRKILLVTTIFCGLSIAQPMAQETIELPEPSKKRGLSVMEAFAKRESNTDFQERELSLQDLADMLWATNGINRPDIGKRTAPSAINAQDIDLYLALKQGVYLYNAVDHTLELINKGDFRDLSVRREEEPLAPCVLFLIADPSRYREDIDPDRVKGLNNIDGGIVSQNLSLFCAGIGLSTRPKAMMDYEAVYKEFKLTGGQRAILNHPVGYRK